MTDKSNSFSSHLSTPRTAVPGNTFSSCSEKTVHAVMEKVAAIHWEIAALREEVTGLSNRLGNVEALQWQQTSLQKDLAQPRQKEKNKRKGPLMAVGICAIHILWFWVFVAWLDPIFQPSSPSNFLLGLIILVPFLLVGNILAATDMKGNIPEALRLCFFHLCLYVFIESTMNQIRLQQNPSECDEGVLVFLACISSLSILAEYSFSPSLAKM